MAKTGEESPVFELDGGDDDLFGLDEQVMEVQPPPEPVASRGRGRGGRGQASLALGDDSSSDAGFGEEGKNKCKSYCARFKGPCEFQDGQSVCKECRRTERTQEAILSKAKTDELEWLGGLGPSKKKKVFKAITKSKKRKCWQMQVELGRNQGGTLQ